MSADDLPLNLFNGELFPGSIVKCTTCFDVEKHGEVIAFDHEKNVLVLKSSSACGKPDLNDVSLINIRFIKSIEVIKKFEKDPKPLPALNTAKLLDRFREEYTQKITLAQARSDGASFDGILLFRFLRKVMPVDAISWSSQNINVMDEVLIKPPYQIENIFPIDSKATNSQCLNHVRKTVERFHKEEKLKASQHG